MNKLFLIRNEGNNLWQLMDKTHDPFIIAKWKRMYPILTRHEVAYPSKRYERLGYYKMPLCLTTVLLDSVRYLYLPKNTKTW